MNNKAQSERLLEDDTFTVWTPNGFEILEKSDGTPDTTEDERRIGGYCSTEGLDRQGEVVIAKGLNFNDFINWGYFNDNHKQDTAAVLGYPTLARLDVKKGWYTEGYLIKGFPPSDKVWELALALKRSGAPRRLGFSIEGKVLERNSGNKIVRADVRNVAITNCPVNTSCTWSTLSKAFASPDEVIKSKHRQMETVFHRPNTRKLTIDQAVTRLQRLRPHFSKAVCERIVRIAMVS